MFIVGSREIAGIRMDFCNFSLSAYFCDDGITIRLGDPHRGDLLINRRNFVYDIRWIGFVCDLHVLEKVKLAVGEVVD